MNLRVIIIGILLILLSPTILADGNSDYSVIMRNTTIQPSSATVEGGTTLVFFNVVNQTRDLSSNSPEWSCSAGPSNSTSIEDECRLNLTTWSAGDYQIQIEEGGEAVATFSFTITAHDTHSSEDGHSHDEDGTAPHTQEIPTQLVIFVIFSIVYWFILTKRN